MMLVCDDCDFGPRVPPEEPARRVRGCRLLTALWIGWWLIGGAKFGVTCCGSVLDLNSACTSIPARASADVCHSNTTAGRTFLEEDALEQGVLVAQHQTLIGGMAMALLEALQRVFMLLDRRLQLLDVLGPPLTEGGLGLTIPLLSLFGCSVDLAADEYGLAAVEVNARTGFLPPFLFWT